MIVAVINYLYHPIISRLMSVENFGEVQGFLSFFTSISILLGAFGTIAINIVANKSNEERIAYLQKLYRISLVCMAVIALIIMSMLGYIERALNFHSLTPFIPLLITLFISATLTFRTSYLQGTQNFAALSLSNIIGSASKLILTVVIILAGGAVFGVIFGFMLTQAVVLMYVWIKTRRSFATSAPSATSIKSQKY